MTSRMHRCALTVGCGAAVLLAGGPAAAETVCSSVDEFNAAMAADATHTEDATLTFDVVGVSPADFPGTKGSLAQMRDTTCVAGSDATIKVYGAGSPVDHPDGTLKLEYGNACCGGACSEGWADPNPSEVIFVDGSESCNVTMYVNPDSIGYSLVCDSGTFDAVGDNTYGNVVDQIVLLEYLIPAGGTTWGLPNATASNDQVCYVPLPTDTMSIDVPVLQDVTADPSAPTTVYADVGDLVVEAGTQEAYLEFAVPEIAGKVTGVVLSMHTRTESSSEGDGGEVYVVSSSDWSETTLTWDTKPAYGGASLGRIGPAGVDAALSLDLGTVVDGAGSYSFAVVSPATDSNGTHFFSKEGSAADAASLRIQYVVVDADGDGTPDGPDCDDTNASVNPDATESCNGIDDNCDGNVDEGCPGGAADESGSAGGTGDGTGGATSGAGGSGDGSGGQTGGLTFGISVGLDGGGGSGGCACTTGRREVPTPALLTVALLALARRRRR